MAMFHRLNTKRSTRVEARSRYAHSRRLGIESLESRRLLSNNQLDYEIWNLDTLQDDYAVISQGGALQITSTEANFRDSAGIRLNVEWVMVPGMSLSAAEANQLAFRHWESAMTSGTFTANELQPLYAQWVNGFGLTSGFDSVPVYAIGVKGLDTTTSKDGGFLFSGLGYSISNSSWPSIVVSPGNLNAFDASFFSSRAIELHVMRSENMSDMFDADSPSDDTQTELQDLDKGLTGWVAGSTTDVFATVPIVPTPVTPTLVEPPAAPVPSDSLAGLDDVVDDLLSQDVIVDSQNDADLLGSSDFATSNTDSPMAAGVDDNDVAETAETESEGGMVPVEMIVATVTEGSLPIAPVEVDVAADVEGLEIGGELARVAVMELIEGATEPTAPALGQDTITVLAMNDAAGAVMQFVSTRGGQNGTGEWIADIEYVAEQVGGVLVLVLPGDAGQIASVASAAGNLLTSVALPGFSELLASDVASEAVAGVDARASVFSELGEERQEALTGLGREHLVWLAAVPVAALLAAERLIAPRKKVPPKLAAVPMATS